MAAHLPPLILAKVVTGVGTASGSEFGISMLVKVPMLSGGVDKMVVISAVMKETGSSLVTTE